MEEIKNYKQIYEDLSTGKNLLLDYNNNQFECTKLGTKKPNYFREITGQDSYQARLENGLITKIQYDKPNHYNPFSNRLVGSLMYPRPLSIPFFNNENNNEGNKEKILLDEIKKEDLYKTAKNKKIFLKEKNKNEVPNFLCMKLAVDSPKDKKRLISLLKNEIDNRKKKYRYQPKYYRRDGIYQGLSQHKKDFENNLNKNMYNGEKIQNTTQKDINNKFHVIKKLIIKNGLNKMHANKEEVNKEEYNKLYRIKKIQEMTNQNFFKRNDLSLKSNINNRNNNSKLKQSFSVPRNNNMYGKVFRDNKIRRRLKKDDSNLDSMTQNQNDIKYNISTFNKSVKFNSTVTTCYNYNTTNYNNESKLSNTKISKNEVYSPKSLHALKRTLSDFHPCFSNYNSGENDEIIFKEINTMKENKIIRNLKEMEKNCEHENELIKGYQIPMKEELNIEPIKYKSPNYVSPATIYKKEMELFIKVNPIEHEKEMRRKLFDEKLLKKKMQNKQIFERVRCKK